MEPLYDKVLVSVEAEWKNEIKTPSGLTGVVFENEIYRLDGAQTKGVIVKLPRGISENHYMLKNLSPLDTLQEGDTIYFHFNEIVPDTRVEIDVFTKPLYMVNISGIFCIVRDGEIIMHGGRILCEPIFDSEVDENTNTKIEKTATGIVKKLKLQVDEQYNMRKARLAYIGNPLINAKTLDVKPGDIIYYDKDADLQYEIEGKKYLVMNQDDILMREI